MGQKRNNGMRAAALAALLLICMTGCGKKKSAADPAELEKARAEREMRKNVKQDNADAKALSEAVNSAVSDYIAWGGGSIWQLNGDYALTGSEFAETDGGTLNPKEMLLYLIQKHDDLSEIGKVAFRLENGRCVYAAVQNLEVYGTYPVSLKADDLQYLDSIQEAADYAKNGMNSRIQQSK